MAAARKLYPNALKDSVASDITTHAKTMEQVCKEHDIQPYQVYAWIGERAMKPPVSTTDATQTHHIPAALRAEMEAMAPQDQRSPSRVAIDPELARRVGEWWLTVRLPQRLKDGK